MSNIRQRAIQYLSKSHKALERRFITASKRYLEKESWTGSGAWWFDLPIKRVLDNPDKNYFLLCEKTDSSFYILKVPNSFLQKHLSDFETRYRDRIRLHLESESKTLFIDQRGSGKINFSRFLIRQ